MHYIGPYRRPRNIWHSRFYPLFIEECLIYHQEGRTEDLTSIVPIDIDGTYVSAGEYISNTMVEAVPIKMAPRIA